MRRQDSFDRLSDDQSYLQLIKEAGGTINAHVKYKETAYYATIPYAKGDWLVRTLAEMIYDNKTDNEEIKRAKLSVELENGEPFWLTELIGYDIFAPIFYRYFPEPSFTESEFGIHYPRYSLSEISLSNRSITKEELVNFHRSYYRPSNMILFISGNFALENMISLIEPTPADHKR